jgi:hypothetical protein
MDVSHHKSNAQIWYFPDTTLAHQKRRNAELNASAYNGDMRTGEEPAR